MAFKTSPPPGTPPGTLSRAHGRPLLASRLRLIRYTDQELEELADASVTHCLEFRQRPGVVWMHLSGLEDTGLIEELGTHLGLHPLALEDVVHGRSPTKVEDYDSVLFLVTRLVTYHNDLRDEQISIFVGDNYVFSCQESHQDYFAIIRDRLRHGQGVIRHHGPDFLMYALLDLTVDYWFPLMETMGERLEIIEDQVLKQPDGGGMRDLQNLRRTYVRLRRFLWPLREAINILIRQENPLITSFTQVYLRDCYDHAFQLIDLLENYREMAAGTIDIYLSKQNTRLNEIMKVLTVIATIFIPLNFLASLYGMNFKPDLSPWNMPELSWYFGYPFALSLMVLVASGMIIFFHRKRWL